MHLPTPYFRARAIRWCHLNFLPADSCCHGNEFRDKIDYNFVPVKDNCALLAFTPLYPAAVLYSVAMGQIPRSTERVSSYSCDYFPSTLKATTYGHDTPTLHTNTRTNYGDIALCALHALHVVGLLIGL